MWERQQHLHDKHNNINVGRARTPTQEGSNTNMEEHEQHHQHDKATT